MPLKIGGHYAFELNLFTDLWFSFFFLVHPSHHILLCPCKKKKKQSLNFLRQVSREICQWDVTQYEGSGGCACLYGASARFASIALLHTSCFLRPHYWTRELTVSSGGICRSCLASQTVAVCTPTTVWFRLRLTHSEMSVCAVSDCKIRIQKIIQWKYGNFKAYFSS